MNKDFHPFVTRWLVGIFILYGLLATTYSLLMPIWEAPDETAHYLVIWYLNRDGQMPSYEQTYEAIQPPAYYWLASGLFRKLQTLDPALIRPFRPPISPEVGGVRYLWTAENYRFIWAAYFLRWLNIPLGGLALWFIYCSARLLFPHHPTIPLATITLIGSTPQFLHNSAAVSNDPLANLGGAFLFWLLLKTFLAQRKEGTDFTFSPSPVNHLMKFTTVTAVSLLLPFLVKLTILPVTLMVITAVFWQLRQLIPPKWLVGGGMAATVLAVVGVALLASQPEAALIWRTTWWRISTIRPDFFTDLRWPLWRIFRVYVAGYWGRVGWDAFSLAAWMLAALTALATMGWLTSLRLLWPGVSLKKFWRLGTAVFFTLLVLWLFIGQQNPWWAVPWGAALAAGLVWFITGTLHVRQLPSATRPPYWELVWGTAVFALLLVVKNSLTTPQYQGRFFFAAIGPLTLLMVTGWEMLLPRKTAVYLPHIILLSMLLLNIWLWFYQIIPNYYQPFLTIPPLAWFE